jgi:hypothetical protein
VSDNPYQPADDFQRGFQAGLARGRAEGLQEAAGILALDFDGLGSKKVRASDVAAELRRIAAKR